MKKGWIWHPGWNAEDKEKASLVYFRKTTEYTKKQKDYRIRISADSRYKLYVNGVLVGIGPCKGDHQIWYWDPVDLSPYLLEGKNVIAVAVLRYPLETAKGNTSVFRTDIPGLFVDGEELTADETWKCIKVQGVQLLPDNPFLSHLYIQEQVGGCADLLGWQEVDYCDKTWDQARPLGIELMALFSKSPVNLQPRPIPSMNLIFRRFAAVQEVRCSATDKEGWENLLAGNGSVWISAHSEEIVEIDAGELMTGFLKLSVVGGAGTVIRILSSESYYQPVGENQWVKRNRIDSARGRLQGQTDTYSVAGCGTEEKPERYEPFWFRTFRFLRLQITTADQPINICGLDYLETGYPLAIKTSIKTSDPTMEQIWDISQRSLRRCMHETYMDCPFYEQMQYAMDARSQILYTYAVSADDRLARRCIQDFSRSQRYDGMIACCYPHTGFSAIPEFAIYYILMIHDHMMYFADEQLVREYLPTVDKILNFFQRNLTDKGYVGKLGGMLFQDNNWSFVDWAVQWDKTGGMPPAGLAGPITMDSLLYIYGLEHGAQLAQFVNRNDTAAEYRSRAEAVRNAVRRYCIGIGGMIQDGPGVEAYSQHCQVFGLLTDTLDIRQGKENLKATLDDPEKFPQCTIAMAYYLFRALEKCDLYEYSNQCWDAWRQMLKDHMTTCVEEPLNQRSDCHAWGALALYELPCVILGVRPTKPGFSDFTVSPVAGHFSWAQGDVITPKGMVHAAWEKHGDSMQISCKADWEEA